MRFLLLVVVLASVAAMILGVREWVAGPVNEPVSVYRRSRTMALLLAASALASVGMAFWMARSPELSDLALLPVAMAVLLMGVGRVHMLRAFKNRPEQRSGKA